MKKTLAVTAIIICCVIFMGAAGASAPVLPSKNFYINDYAAVIDKPYRDAMLETAKNLNEKTGSQIVVLTVQSLAGLDIDSFARDVFKGWKIGGEAGNGALILLFHSEGGTDYRILTGSGLSEVLTEERLNPIRANRMGGYFSSGDYSVGLYEGFASVADIVFEHYGEESGVAAPQKSADGNMAEYLIIAVASLFIMLRAVRVSAKYRKKYANNYVYRPRTYTRAKRSDEDDYPSGFGGIIKLNEPENEGGDETVAESETDKNRQN